MMKKISKFLLFILSFIILSSCSNNNPEELNNLIQTPKQGQLSINGTWEVKEVRGKKNIDEKDVPQKGDLIYIDKNLLAIGDSYAFPPSFSSKYVNLSKYLKNRGIEENKIDKDKNVVVINASQGQLFSKDFIKFSDTEMAIISNDNFIKLEKISNKVDTKILNVYSKRASKERTTTAEGQEIAEDTALLVGVRERVDNSLDDSLNNYYTYLIRIKDDGNISYKKAYGIFLKNKEEYWLVNTKNNNITNNYDELLAYPIRLKSKMSDPSLRAKYSFKDINLNIRLNYVSNDFISIDYTSIANDNPIRKYAILETNAVNNGAFLSLQEFTGEEDSDLIFRERVLEEANINFKGFDEKNLSFDNTNFGIIRNQGQWIFQSSIFTGDGKNFVQNFFPMEIAIGNQMLNKNSDKNTITRDQVRNINGQFKDYYILSNGNYIVIQTPDELLVHRIKDKLIEKKPIYSIPTINSTSIVSLAEQSGSGAENLESAFDNNNEIVEQQN
ncbi:hypothetical protein [Anaerococcus tetradius]|uniref:Lipoprotein n=1 Tax=Anaerococcus tetradius ATCC 35098 TaxID=525255 RepID=C2CFS0_9FIRM|nr:hypothetical protein [Anaerococcus tetradius]EEI83601.1 hypothetical protein HMPREF0077_0330 [Anaerococcus tetradius ATCC 35098]